MNAVAIAVAPSTLVLLLRRNAVVIQSVFAILWAVRLAAVAGPWEVPALVVVAAIVLGRRAYRATGELRARTEFATPEGRAFLRPVTWMSVAQLVASVALPVIASALGHPSLTMPLVALTIGVFLIGFGGSLAVPAVRTIGVVYAAAAVALPAVAGGSVVAWVSAVSTAALLASTWVTARAVA